MAVAWGARPPMGPTAPCYRWGNGSSAGASPLTGLSPGHELRGTWGLTPFPHLCLSPGFIPSAVTSTGLALGGR